MIAKYITEKLYLQKLTPPLTKRYFGVVLLLIVFAHIVASTNMSQEVKNSQN